MIDPTKVVADWEQDYKLMQDQRAEIACLRLTDEEREAIACAAESYADNDDDEDCARVAATLRGVIERLGGER
jgi:hypothetical protein